MMRRYFDINEVVCPHVFEEFGDVAWRFFDPRLLEVMVWLRTTLVRKIYVNSYDRGLTQRGLRCNLCRLVRINTDKEVVYMSAHVLGAALDFDVEGMKAWEVRDWIYDRALELPHPIRFEMKVDWVHLDVATEGPDKIVWF